MKLRASIVIATFNKAEILAKVLASIRAQRVPFPYEIIVVDDAAGGDDDSAKWICWKHEVEKYIPVDRDPIYRNPGFARNIGCRAARGDVLVMQSDDVIHKSPEIVEQLVTRLRPGVMHFAKVYDRSFDPETGKETGKCMLYTGRANPRPLFFLGSLWRRDMYAVGGNDEDFTEPGFEDDWLSLCLTRGLGLIPIFDEDLLAVHHHHPRPRLTGFYARMQAIHDAKVAAAERGDIPWCARGGPWPYIEGEPCPCPSAP